ncbi:MAG TPA: ABC transporter permease [Thermomicrobiales bacterium]|nr:ABC transporter permease [Thermomicrobiales bacterium]
MLAYILNRILWFIPTLLVITLLTFLILQATPGTGVISSGAQIVDQRVVERLEAEYGLDEPLYQQFGIYVWNVLNGDFGTSFVYRPQTVNDIIGRTLPISLQLGVYATILAVVVGVGLGVLSAVHQNGVIDYFSVGVAVLFYSLPNFVMGFVLILVFVVYLPRIGIDMAFNVGGLDSWKDWILPTIALAATPLATIARFTRSSMIEVLQSDFVRVARAKGLRENKVIMRHVIKNALIPIITLIGPIFAAVATGSFFVEAVFNIPGMGRYYVESFVAKDQPMILAVTLIYAVMLAAMNVVVDVLYGFIDPRIRY